MSETRLRPFAALDVPEPAVADDDLLIGVPLFPAGEERPPSGCAVCGIGERGHYRRWHAGRFEKYLPPTQVQILARMRKRQRFNERRRAT